MERFELKQVAKNDPEAIGTAVITTASLSGTDAQKDAFVSSLGADWEPIPEELAELTESFYKCYGDGKKRIKSKRKLHLKKLDVAFFFCCSLK